jgi:di/tricarboxylate transporter
MNWLFETTGGRKMLLGILGIAAMTVLACLKIIDGNEAVEQIKWVIVGVAGALAVSDVGNALKREETPPTPPVSKEKTDGQ